jgi:LysR substrate binding domain
VEILFDDEVAVVVGAQSPWVRSRRLKLANLLDESWILPPADSAPGSLAVEIFRASGLEVPHAPLTTLSIHLCLRMLATGRYVATLPRSILHFTGKGSSLKVADQITSSASPDWHRDIKGSDLESGDTALHQLCPRGCKAVGEGAFALCCLRSAQDQSVTSHHRVCSSVYGVKADLHPTSLKVRVWTLSGRGMDRP